MSVTELSRPGRYSDGMLRHRSTVIAVAAPLVLILSACAGERSDQGTAFRLAIPHIAFPHFGGGPARLQKTVEGRHPVQLWGDTTLGADCVPVGETRLEVTSAPQHGAVAIRPGRLYAVYPEGHPRAYCSGRLVTGTLAVYTAEAGYVGPDQVVLRGTGATGDVGVVTVAIEVEPAPPPRPRAGRGAGPAIKPAPDPLPSVRPRPTSPDAPAPAVLRSPYPGE